MQIFVINVRGMSLTLNVDPFDHVEDVKEQIKVKMGIDQDHQKLSFCGKILLNQKTLRYYNIQSESNLHFSLQLSDVPPCDMDSPGSDHEMFSSPEVNWDDLAAAAKARVDEDIRRRKLRYDIILGVKIETMEQVDILRQEIEEELGCVKNIENGVSEKDDEIANLAREIINLQESINISQLRISVKGKEKKTLYLRKVEAMKKVCQKQSRLDMLLCDMTNLDENMKRIIISEEDILTRSKEKILNENDAHDVSMKEFLNESISAKKALLECPVCYETACPPIHRCPKEHLICSLCLPRMNHKCPTCRTSIPENSFSVFRIAEEIWKEMQNLILKFDNL